MADRRSKDLASAVTRRQFMAKGAALAALSAEGAAALERPPRTPAAADAAPRGQSGFPFDSFRDWIGALEQRGLLLRFGDVDQDAYEGTAIMYRVIDEYGHYEAPAILFERLKIDGRWVDGPLIANDQGHWDTEALVFGLEPVPGDGRATYRKVMSYLTGLLEQGRGSWPMLDPVEVSADKALCKQVVLRGDEIDLTRYAFIQTNPADAGRYINTGSVFTMDPELGMNYGTYRCQLKGPRKIGVNPEPNQTGWRMLMAMRERGDTLAKISIALGQDPIVWVVSGSTMTSRRAGPVDELALAGGLRGKPLEVVRSETNDILVPAHVEMVIEGEVPLDQPMEPEGPFGEMYGYLGLKKEENFWMNVTAVTHRRDPWLLNSFTGATRGFVTAPLEAAATLRLRRAIPGLVDLHSPVEAVGWTFISVDKQRPGQGLEVGKKVAEFVPIAKVVVVVDREIDVLNRQEVLHTVSSRWQPHTASHIFESIRGMPLDPSSPNRPMSSKIVIDATRQWPEEGGPEVYPERNRTLLEQGAPGVFDRVDAKWGDLIKGA